MLKIISATRDIFIQANTNLPKNYIQSLIYKHTFYESIIARYLIFLEKKFLPKIDEHGKPVFENNNFWSISHKKDIVFVWIDNFPLWIDIERIKERWIEVFSLHKEAEYYLLGKKDFHNFYILWTIKESVIKLNLAGIDEWEEIKIDNIERKKTIIDWITFEFQIWWKFKNKDFVSYSWFENDLVWSVSRFS